MANSPSVSFSASTSNARFTTSLSSRSEEIHHFVPAGAHLLQRKTERGNRLIEWQGKRVDCGFQRFIGAVACVLGVGSQLGCGNAIELSLG